MGKKQIKNINPAKTYAEAALDSMFGHQKQQLYKGKK